MFARILPILGLAALLFPVTSKAAVSPLGVAVIPWVEFPPEDYTITGLRVSALWGRHRSVYGIDLGLLGNVTDQTFSGIAISGLFNVTHGNTTAVGLQFAGIANVNTSKTKVVGLQLAVLANFNASESSVTGLQLALANLSPFTKVYGFQVGVFNQALEVYGFQIGLVNRTRSLHGLQLGLLNINETGLFYVAPILNVGF